MVSQIIAPLFVGIVGGLTANFLAKTAWDYYTRPKLSADDSFDLTFDYTEDGELEVVHYSIVIENLGKRPARNCSANMSLDGKTDGIHYHYEGRLPWENGSQQMTINPNQRVKLEFCRANYGDLEGVILFPSEGEWDIIKGA
ncbi:MAG: hypothetical protein U5J64_00630 [Halobacteriales archaeon]|nr:hypothetical protein [Halobacteriales archaeon]